MKKVIALSFLTAGFFLNAQTIGNSPYAAFGIGDTKYDNSTEISSMGGISAAYIPDFNGSFNFSNPAANRNLTLTSFRVELTNENNKFKSNYNTISSSKSSTYLSNISLAFPLSPKVKFGIGYQPYSSKSYEITKFDYLDNDVVVGNNFKGEGTLNLLQAAASYNVTDELSVGARVNYFFGKLTDRNELVYSNAELINGHETTTNIKNFNFTLGSAYRLTTASDRFLTFGAVATFGNTSDMTTRYVNSTYYYVNSDIRNQSIIEDKESKSKNLLPFQGSFGVGYGNENRWFGSAQIDYKKGNEINYVGRPFQYNDSYRAAVGGWIIPNYNNFRNYFSRVIYRFGAYYEKGALNLTSTGAVNAGGTNINQFGITAGATFPFKNSNVSKMSGIDVGIEVGKRGTLENNLINQTFFNLKIGVNFADKWFNKRLYN